MKLRPPSILFGLGLVGFFAAAAIAVTTNPVGFTSVTVTPGIRAISLPFNKIPAAAGPVTSVGALSITSANAGWTPNQFQQNAGSGVPLHLVRMTSGTAIGKTFRISSNTADTLTLLSGSDLTGVAASNTFQIFASETLASLFGDPPPNITTHANQTQADNIQIRGTSAWLTYLHDGQDWVRFPGMENSNNVPITPEQGFLFVRRSGNYTFTNLGAVPITNLIMELPPNRILSFGNRFPVATNLVGLGLHKVTGWNKSSNPTIADNVLVRGTSSWVTYSYDANAGGPTGPEQTPGSWVRQPGGEINQNPNIPLGTSVVLVRRAGSTILLDQPLPYTLAP